MKEQLCFKKDCLSGKQEEYDYDLINEAISKLVSSSQSQFEEIKQEMWFNRLFDMLTFSNKTEIRVAEQIENIAQAQQIFLKMLQNLSVTDMNISQMVVNSIEDIRRLAEQDMYLLDAINRLEDAVTGIKPDMDLQSLSEYEKNVLSACLYKVCDRNQEPSSYQQRYANAVLGYIQTDAQMESPFMAISKLDENARKRILGCCLEYIFLKDCKEDSYSGYQQIIDEFNIGNKTINELKTQIRNTVKLRGADGICSKFEKHNAVLNDDTFFADFNDQDGDSYNYENSENLANHNEKCIIKHSFEELEQLVNDRIAPEKYGFLNLRTKFYFGKILDDKEKDELLVKEFPNLERKTVINVTQGDKYYLIFTTYALHLYNFAGNKEKFLIPYENITELNLNTDVQDEIEKFIFINSYGNRIEVSDKNITGTKLEELLTEIKKQNQFAPTDERLCYESLGFNNLDDRVKIGYYHIISCILKDNNLSLAELFRNIIAEHDEKLIDSWDEVTKENESFESFIQQWVQNIPYPYEEALSRRLIRSICTILQYTTDTNELSVKQKLSFSKILFWFDESEREKIIKHEIIGSHAKKDFMDGRTTGKEFAEKIKEYTIDEMKVAGYKTVGVTLLKNLAITGLCVVSGPLGIVTRILLAMNTFSNFAIAGYFFKNIFYNRNNKILQLRQKLYNEDISSYSEAINKWNDLPQDMRQKYLFKQTYETAIEKLEKQLNANDFTKK